MVDTEDMTDDEFRVHISEIVSRELGLGAFARFLRLYHSGRGDYTRDRHLWLGEQTLAPDEEPAKESQTKAA